MRYIGILLLGVLLGGGAAIFFLGAPRATSVPGVTFGLLADPQGQVVGLAHADA